MSDTIREEGEERTIPFPLFVGRPSDVHVMPGRMGDGDVAYAVSIHNVGGEGQDAVTWAFSRECAEALVERLQLALKEDV